MLLDRTMSYRGNSASSSYSFHVNSEKEKRSIGIVNSLQISYESVMYTILIYFLRPEYRRVTHDVLRFFFSGWVCNK
jgi:hypothetical protein